jgi:hypothetical protein
VSPPDDPQKLLKLDDQWSPEWRSFITEIYNKQLDRKKTKTSALYPKNPLDALLATAWGLQTGGGKKKVERRSSSPPVEFPPWTAWWEKERLMLAVMQLVVRHQQTLFWSGTTKVLALSASNITLFLSICREVWDQWRRRSHDGLTSLDDAILSFTSNSVGWKTQAVAIDHVSHSWHRNFSRQPGRPSGDIRMKFIDQVASWLREALLADTSMSYPGANGFSLRETELERYASLRRLLEEAVGWGDLYEVPHTTKHAKQKHRDPRKKYYVNPILSAHFQIPEAHTKEPLYAPVDAIFKLAASANALSSPQPELQLS